MSEITAREVSDLQADLRSARCAALNLAYDLRVERKHKLFMLACLLKEAGGELRVKRDTVLGLGRDVVIEETTDYRTNELVLRLSQ